jgi:hypothetical protein
MLKQTIRRHHATPGRTSAGNLSGSEFGDGLGGLRDGMLGELVGEDEAHRGLYLAGGGLLVVAGGFLHELLEYVEFMNHDGGGGI